MVAFWPFEYWISPPFTVRSPSTWVFPEPSNEMPADPPLSTMLLPDTWRSPSICRFPASVKAAISVPAPFWNWKVSVPSLSLSILKIRSVSALIVSEPSVGPEISPPPTFRSPASVVACSSSIVRAVVSEDPVWVEKINFPLVSSEAPLWLPSIWARVASAWSSKITRDSQPPSEFSAVEFFKVT